ncbi:OmpA family protein [Hymenobacter rubripertinctus]|nr:OmpA family protein [Hymenobacter rubripertinctus]
MEHTLANSIQVAFRDETLDHLAHETDEAAMALRLTFQRAIPVVVQALTGRVSGPDGPEAVWQLSREAYGASVLEPTTPENEQAWARRGDALMRGLLGESFHFTALRLATAGGIALPAAERVLSAAAVATLGVIGEHSQEHNFSPAALAAWLQQEGTALNAPAAPQPAAVLAPAAASSASAPPVDAVVPVPGAAAGAWVPMGGGRAYTPEATATGRGAVRWPWGLLLLLAVVLGYLFGHQRESGPAAALSLTPPPDRVAASAPAPVAATTTGRYDDASGNYIYDTGQPLILRLADGTTQKVGANSTENRLYMFLADPTQQVDSINRTKGWINFDRVYFDPGATTLTDESFMQLRNIASILNTFPGSVVKIGGYTDSTGAPLKNFQLSEERAKIAMLAIAGMGVDLNRVQAKGYGGKYFITPNTTAEGRALNRRISIRVLKK